MRIMRAITMENGQTFHVSADSDEEARQMANSAMPHTRAVTSPTWAERSATSEDSTEALEGCECEHPSSAHLLGCTLCLCSGTVAERYTGGEMSTEAPHNPATAPEHVYELSQGSRTVCRCGWASPILPSHEARAAIEAHIAETAQAVPTCEHERCDLHPGHLGAHDDGTWTRTDVQERLTVRQMAHRMGYRDGWYELADWSSLVPADAQPAYMEGRATGAESRANGEEYGD